MVWLGAGTGVRCGFRFGRREQATGVGKAHLPGGAGEQERASAMAVEVRGPTLDGEDGMTGLPYAQLSGRRCRPGPQRENGAAGIEAIKEPA